MTLPKHEKVPLEMLLAELLEILISERTGAGGDEPSPVLAKLESLRARVVL